MHVPFLFSHVSTNFVRLVIAFIVSYMGITNSINDKEIDESLPSKKARLNLFEESCDKSMAHTNAEKVVNEIAEFAIPLNNNTDIKLFLDKNIPHGMIQIQNFLSVV